MGFFNFIESFFFISLAITFVLIMMIIYHFKERINVMEKKNETTIEILNNLAKEITSLRGFVIQMNSVSSPPPMSSSSSSPFFQLFSSNAMGAMGFNTKNNINLGEDEDECDINQYGDNIQISQLNIGEELTNSEIESEIESDDGKDDCDYDSINEEEDDGNKENKIHNTHEEIFDSEIQIEKIVVLDEPELQENLEIVEPLVKEDVNPIALTVSNLPVEDYNKLTTTQLKNIVLDKKIYAGDVNKLKRPALLKMLDANP